MRSAFVSIALLLAPGVLFSQEVFRLDLPDIPQGNVGFSGAGFIEISAAARQFTVAIEDVNSGRDVDLFLRRGSEFSPLQSGQSFSQFLAQVRREAQFYSEGPTASEIVVAQDFVEPLAGQTWFIALAIGGGTGGSIDLSVQSTSSAPQNAPVAVRFDNPENDPDCSVSPWNDSSPFTPIDGNTATTLGEARRNAMQEAARLLGSELKAPLELSVAACWESLGGGSNEAPLGRGSSRSFGVGSDTPGTPDTDILFPQAVIKRLAGTPVCNLLQGIDCAFPDLVIRFNVDVDGSALGNSDFYYGFNGTNRTAGDPDFISTAMHELVHGLGFLSLMDPDGQLPDIGNNKTAPTSYSALLADVSSGAATAFTDLGDGQRLAAATSGTRLQWLGGEASVSVPNDLATAGQGLVRLHAPATFAEGSSISHVADSYCQLMTASITDCANGPLRSIGLAKNMLHEAGWHTGPAQSPYIGLMFDRDQFGHGFDFQFFGTGGDGLPIYVMTFYSYQADSREPEWFQAVGTMENGVFSSLTVRKLPDANGFGFSRFMRDEAGNVSDEKVGNVVLSFNNAQGSRACQDGVNRADAGFLASMQWTIDGSRREWCVEPLIPTVAIPVQDFGGLWWAGPQETGWGFTIENFISGNAVGLFVLVYVYADNDEPIWYLGLIEGFVAGQPVTIELFQREGFSRLVSGTVDDVNDLSAGSLTLTLVSPTDNLNAGNTASIDVDFQGLRGGSWVRTNAPIARISQPR